MRSETHIEIRLASPDEREQAIDYISENMRKKHGAHPPRESTPEHICIAVEDGSIVGALCMQFGTADSPLPMELQFDFDRLAVPVPYVREKTVYYSRWNSSRGIGPAIWLAASMFAQRSGMVFTAATGKKEMLRYYAEVLRCQWHPIQGARIRPEAVGESERDYFFGPEQPMPWLGVLEEQIRFLPSLVRSLQEKSNLIFKL